MQIRILGGDYSDNFVDPLIRDFVSDMYPGVQVTTAVVLDGDQLVKMASTDNFDFAAVFINNVIIDDRLELVRTLAKDCNLPVLIMFPHSLAGSYQNGAVFLEATAVLQMPSPLEKLFSALRLCLGSRNDLHTRTSKCSICGTSYQHGSGLQPLTCGGVHCVERLWSKPAEQKQKIEVKRPIVQMPLKPESVTIATNDDKNFYQYGPKSQYNSDPYYRKLVEKHSSILSAPERRRQEILNGSQSLADFKKTDKNISAFLSVAGFGMIPMVFVFAIWGPAPLLVVGAILALLFAFRGHARKQTKAVEQYLMAHFAQELNQLQLRADAANKEILSQWDLHCVNYKGYPPDWDERRAIVKSRDGHQCKGCGWPDGFERRARNLNVHHMKPLS